jgi:hypothetical protein
MRTEELEARLSSLERGLAHWRRCALAAFSLIGLAAALGLGPGQVPDVLRAKRFEVVNADGKALATLTQGPDGGRLVVQSPSGTILFELGQSANKDAFAVLRTAGDKDAIVLGTYQSGAGRVQVNNAQGGEAVLLGSTVSDSGVLRTSAKSGSKLFEVASLQDTNAGSVEVYSEQGAHRVSIASNAAGGSLLIHRANAEVALQIRSNNEGDGDLVIFSREGKRIVRATGTVSKQGRVITYDASENETGGLPR